MADRIISMRSLLRERVEALGSPHRYGGRCCCHCRCCHQLHAGDVHASSDFGRLQKLTYCCRPASRRCSWKHITDQIGMFAYTGLTPEQARHPASCSRYNCLDTLPFFFPSCSHLADCKPCSVPALPRRWTS